MKKSKRLIGLAVIILGWGMGLHAATIGINIAADSVGEADMAASDLAGAPGVRTNNWNNIVSKNNTTLAGAAAVYADGSVVGGTFQAVLTTPRARHMNPVTATNEAMLVAGGNTVWNGQTASLSLTGIPFDSYEIYVYCRDSGTARGGSLAVGATTYYVRDDGAGTVPASDGTGYVEITGTVYNASSPEEVLWGNFARFDDLTGDSQTVSFTALDMGDGNHRHMVCGIQVVETQLPDPTAIFAAVPTDGFAPLEVTFTDTSYGTGITSREWDFGDGTTLTTTNVTVQHTYSTAGTNTVSLTVTGSEGSDTRVQTDLIKVGQSSAPSAGFSADPVTGEAPVIITFTDTSTGTITNRFWDFGDGTTLNTTETNVTHTYVFGGMYTVQLIAEGPSGSSTNTMTDLLDISAGEVVEAININIAAYDTNTALMATTSLAGAPGVRSAFWNNMRSYLTSTLAGADARYANGNLIGGSFQAVLNAPRSGYLGATGLVDDELMYYGGNSAWNSETGTVVLTGIPYDTYEIYVYCDRHNSSGRGGSISVDGTTYYHRTDSPVNVVPSSDGTGYIQMTTTSYDTNNLPAVSWGNYAHFEDLSGTTQTVSFAALDMGNEAHRVTVCGIQIVSTSGAGGPTDPPAEFWITSDSLGAGEDVIHWTTEAGYLYSVLYSTNLLQGFVPLQTGLDYTVTSYTNSVSTPQIFYKVEAQW